MPEADTRKRSRSPSDSDQPKHKRANTGATNDSHRSSHHSSVAGDVKMEPRADDTAPSTPDAKGVPSDSADRASGDGADARGDASATTSAAPTSSTASAPPAANIHMRCLIVTQDASIIIGKGGSHVNEIREKSGARVMVSESIPGNPERILNVSGPLDAVSKVCSFFVRARQHERLTTRPAPYQAFGLIVRRINDEPFDKPSVPGSRAVTIKFMIPNSRMGSVIGKGGTKIKEIQDASGARLNASEGMLPGSTEVCRLTFGASSV